MKPATPGPSEPSERLSPRHSAGKRLKVCGASTPGTPTLYIPKLVFEEVLQYAGGDRQRSRGGFFMGYPGQWKGERYVELLAHVPALHGVGEEMSFKFTHKTFKELFAKGEAQWPDASLVGWYYTHLNCGIFLSGEDQQILRNFFNQWWMFALVLDPIQESLGFFAWKGNQIVTTGFTIVEAT